MWKLKSSSLADRRDRRDEREQEQEDPGREEERRASAASACPRRAQRPRAGRVRERRERDRRELQRVERPVGQHASHSRIAALVKLFHYHLVTSQRARRWRRGTSASSRSTSSRATAGSATSTSRSSPGVSWEELDRIGFKLRLTELERGAVNVVVQPGQWELPRVDHLGLALDEDEFADVVDRAVEQELRVQAHGGRRTFIATNAGYRLEVHPPREWLDELLEPSDVLQLTELQLLADEPEAKAAVLAELLDTEQDGTSVDGRRLDRPLHPRRPAGTPAAARRAAHLTPDPGRRLRP